MKVISTNFAGADHPYALNADGSLTFEAKATPRHLPFTAKITYVAVSSSGKESNPAEVRIIIQRSKPVGTPVRTSWEPDASFESAGKKNFDPVVTYAPELILSEAGHGWIQGQILLALDCKAQRWRRASRRSVDHEAVQFSVLLHLRERRSRLLPRSRQRSSFWRQAHEQFRAPDLCRVQASTVRHLLAVLRTELREASGHPRHSRG